MGSKSAVTSLVTTINATPNAPILTLSNSGGNTITVTDNLAVKNALDFARAANDGVAASNVAALDFAQRTSDSGLAAVLQALTTAKDASAQALTFSEKASRDALAFAKDLSMGPGEETSRYITLAAIAAVVLVLVFSGGKINA